MNPTSTLDRPSPSTTTTPQAVSKAYCVKPFDRRDFPPDTTGDVTGLPSEQKTWDIHFTDVAYHEKYPVIWCGFTSFAGDLLWTFDPDTKKFESKGFLEHVEEHETKIHRGMRFGSDGRIYFGTAGLVNLQQRTSAPGGRLFAYDPDSDKYEFLGRPIEHDYIQTTAIDLERGLMYGTTYPCAQFFVWDLEKRKTIYRAFIDHLPHQVCIDDDGACWSSYCRIPYTRRYRMFKYDPNVNDVTWTDVPVPGILPDDDAMIDSFVNGGDGFLYAGLLTGSLMRFDPKTIRFEMIGAYASSRGFGALTEPVDGKLYGIAGTADTTEIMSYDLNTREVEMFGPCIDHEKKTSNFRPHELVLGPNRRLYCPETDNSERQCYFWEVQLP